MTCLKQSLEQFTVEHKRQDFNLGYQAAIRQVVLHLAKLDGSLGRQPTQAHPSARQLAYDMFCAYSETLAMMQSDQK